ncbi:MAG: hypothetical protein R2684_05020 [Pyrinomonadaceae bacterium]
MELDGREQLAVTELGNAVNTAIEQSQIVADAINHLRRMGLEPNLNLKIEIDLTEIEGDFVDPSEEFALEFTEEDLHALRRMKIKAD